ncbi:MAG: large conductance mechanosensitive channel protein MscL [Clostridia bacterium]|jgi:large conductance mechanosensitive channel|nr:large conductance mechanosensitive channel protein MscL [Clostridia bacterium]
MKGTFWKDFKKFITKGNVIDMAVGVVIGGAFSKIVTGLVNNVINPFVSIFMRSGSLDNIKTVLQPAVLDEAGAVVTAEIAILWGVWFQTILDFLISAFCIFLVLRIIMNAKNMIFEEKLEREAAEKKAAEEKAAAEKAAADEAAAKAAKEKAEAEERFKNSIVNQETLLSSILEELKKGNK